MSNADLLIGAADDIYSILSSLDDAIEQLRQVTDGRSYASRLVAEIVDLKEQFKVHEIVLRNWGCRMRDKEQ